MHPDIHYDLMQARAADWQRQAQRAMLAAAARQARRARRHQPGHAAPATARRVLTALAARALRPAQ